MPRTIEDFVPYDESVQWRLHEASFERGGIAAWTDGAIPSHATTNYALARQHAELLVHVLGAAGGERPAVLEVGSGAGVLAANVLRALDTGRGAAGRALARRLVYVLSDFSATVVRQAAASPALRAHVAAGRVVPAVFDLRRPRALLDLDGAPLRIEPGAAIASYVCCVSPLKILRRTPSGWREKYVRVIAPADDGNGAGVAAGGPEPPLRELVAEFEWRPVEPARLLPAGPHRGVLRDLAPGEAGPPITIPYPRAFLDLVASLARTLPPGGAVLINDFGTHDRAALEGEGEHEPRLYGDTLNHGVSFAVLDAFCARAGLAIARTPGPLRSIHTAAVWRDAPAARGRAEVFRRIYRRPDGEDLRDFEAAGRGFAERGEQRRAAAFYERALRLDPASVEALEGFARACVEGGFPRLALRAIARAKRLGLDGACDLDLILGHTYSALGRHAKAVAAYRRSLARADGAPTRASLGRALKDLGRLREAYLAFRAALALDPENGTIRASLDEVKTAWTEALTRPPGE